MHEITVSGSKRTVATEMHYLYTSCTLLFTQKIIETQQQQKV